MTACEEIAPLADVPVEIEAELDRRILSVRQILQLKGKRHTVEGTPEKGSGWKGYAIANIKRRRPRHPNLARDSTYAPPLRSSASIRSLKIRLARV